MKICDNCKAKCRNLTHLVEDFDSLDVCDGCYKCLDDAMVECRKKVNKFNKEIRRIAFLRWRLPEHTMPRQVPDGKPSKWKRMIAVIHRGWS